MLLQLGSLTRGADSFIFCHRRAKMDIHHHRTCCCPLSVSIESHSFSFDLLDYLYASKFENDPDGATSISSLNSFDSVDLSSSPESLYNVEVCPYTRLFCQADLMTPYMGETQVISDKLDSTANCQENLFPELSQRLEDDIMDVDFDELATCDAFSLLGNTPDLNKVVSSSCRGGHHPYAVPRQNNEALRYVSMDDVIPSPTKSEEEVFCYDDDEGRLKHNRPRCKKRREKRRRMDSEDSDTDDSVEGFSPLQAKREKRHQSHKNRVSVSHNAHSGSKSKGPRPIHLYQFLIDLLRNEEYCPRYINWVSRDEGIFRLVDSAAVAQLWGQCKNRENMTYEKMSRALRYYYENGILERVPNCRLQYRFGKVVYEEYGDLL